MSKEICFITFMVPRLCDADEKYAVRCDNMEQARVVYKDADSLDGVVNIRLRRCRKPRHRMIMSFDNYWNYADWL